MVTVVASLALAWLGSHVGETVAQGPASWSLAVIGQSIIDNPLRIGTDPASALGALAGFVLAWAVCAYTLAARGNRRDGVEAGSARWATVAELRGFADKRKSRIKDGIVLIGKRESDKKAAYGNIILTKKVALKKKGKRFDQETDRNNNVIVIGGSGSGKTRYFVKPNILQSNASYFVTDPKDELINEVGDFLVAAGYKMPCLNTIAFERSARYNPLKYVKTDADILRFVECLIKNTKGDDGNGGTADPFWENAERLLYMALIAYLRDWCAPSDYTLNGLLTLLALAKAKEEDEDYKSPLDCLYEEVRTGRRLVARAHGPRPAKAASAASVEETEFASETSTFEWTDSNLRHRPTGRLRTVLKESEWSPARDFALSNYDAFKVAAGKTLKSILISCNVRLKPLSIAEMGPILAGDDMEIDRIGEAGCKHAVFAVLSDQNKTFSFLHAILMWQTLNELCERALKKHNGKLPTTVQFVFDEFANIGLIPNFEEMIAVVRSRNIGVAVILQSMSQLEGRYGKWATVIKDNCNTTLFLGSDAPETCKEISEMLGKETIQTVGHTRNKGSQGGYSQSFQAQGRDLMDPSEVGRMSMRKAIVMIAGARPIIDDKYPLEKHPRYRFIDPSDITRHKHALLREPFDYLAYLPRLRGGGRARGTAMGEGQGIRRRRK